jgi:stage IV sporulation protein B
MIATRKTIKAISIFTAGICTILFVTILYYQFYLPESYTVDAGENLSLASPTISASQSQNQTESVAQKNQKKEMLNLWGIFPIKEVAVQSCEPVTLVPSGNPFGIKMFTEGAMVVGFSPILTEEGNRYPGKEAGLKEGDTILKINGKEISRNEEAAFLIEESRGKPLCFTIKRGKETKEYTVNPVLSVGENTYKTGILIRDSAAGIGTITYVDPSTNVFGGLGHAICDIDTGEILSVGSGEVCEVEVHNIHRGEKGNPGELLGAFTSNTPMGTIVNNNETGIYGQLFDSHLSGDSSAKAYPMARKQEVKPGKATILCRLNNDSVEEYDIQITSIDYNPKNKIKNMVIKVTDDELLELTGGIVQGMSGTPILQNGKLVGAVTHVFVNNPEKGFGIFAENMYENSKKIEAYEEAS